MGKMDSEASKVDHEDRLDLKLLLEKPRDVKYLQSLTHELCINMR